MFKTILERLNCIISKYTAETFAPNRVCGWRPSVVQLFSFVLQPTGRIPSRLHGILPAVP